MRSLSFPIHTLFFFCYVKRFTKISTYLFHKIVIFDPLTTLRDYLNGFCSDSLPPIRPMITSQR